MSTRLWLQIRAKLHSSLKTLKEMVDNGEWAHSHSWSQGMESNSLMDPILLQRMEKLQALLKIVKSLILVRMHRDRGNLQVQVLHLTWEWMIQNQVTGQVMGKVVLFWMNCPMFRSTIMTNRSMNSLMIEVSLFLIKEMLSILQWLDLNTITSQWEQLELTQLKVKEVLLDSRAKE